MLRRRTLALGAAALAAGIGGCAADDLSTPAPAASSPRRGSTLTPWLTLTGGWRTDPTLPMQTGPATGPRLNFLAPVGVAARNEVLLVADQGLRALLRLDRMRDTATLLAPLPAGAPEAGVSMQLGNDLNAWVALPSEHMVVQYDPRGRVVRRWINEADAPRPVAVVVPEDRSAVLVGDGATARIVVFDPLGQVRGLLGGRRSPNLQSIADMALGPRGLYVLDRAAQQVVVLDAQGVPVEIIGENELVHPRALAVDRSGRVFVADDADQRIKVFRGRELLGSYGGQGAGPERFGRIESLALDGNMLYVADSANARVQVLLVAPPTLEQARALR